LLLSLTEFSFLIRYYNLLYQSLIPNCKLTIKILKQHLEISSDVENFVLNGESSTIRCQRIINLLLVQLDTARKCKHFCDLFDMISVIPDLPDKLRTGTYDDNMAIVLIVCKNNFACISIRYFHSIWKVVEMNRN